MKWYTHAIFAIVMGAVIGCLLNADLTIRFFIITVISSLLIDFAEKAIYEEHKRQLHNIFTIIPCILAYLFFDITVGAALIAGTMSHILLDTLTPTGCPLFWPVYRRHYHISWKHGDNKAREKRILATVTLLSLLTILVLIPQGPFMSAITAWTNNTKKEGDPTNSTRLDLRINLNNPQQDMWIHPLQNGSIFIDVVDDGQVDYQPVYYPVYKTQYKTQYRTPPNSNSSQVSEDGEEEA